MANNDAQYTSQAQHIAQSLYGSMQSMVETQINVLQRLGGVQQSAFQQAIEAVNDQLQLLGRVRDPREYASAQADLVKEHGQRYVDSIKQAIDITAEGWRAHADRLEQAVNRASDNTRSVPRKAA